MPKVFVFDNLVTPSCRTFTSLIEAVNASAESVSQVAQSIKSKTKNERRDWFKIESSRWPCISLAEGVNPALRISSDNPPALLHGFIADYDAVGKRYTEEELASLASRCVYPPAAGGPSLSGEGVHTIWLFEEPIPVLGDTAYARKIYAECYKNLRVSNFIHGFDPAFKIPDRLLSIDPTSFGFLTARAETQMVDKHSTRMWAGNITKDFEFEGQKVELSKIYEQVQKLFPGRWTGDFNVGSRGPRFWDSSASDTSAAVVTATGMVFFSNGGGFKPWNQIFGHDVISKLTADSLAEITSDWYYDSTNHDYVYDLHGKYETKNRTQFMDRLELMGLEDDLERKRTIAYVEDHNSVTAVVSLANQKKGTLIQSGLNYINTTKTIPIRPAKGSCEFTKGLHNAMFGPEQVDYFLAWMQDSVRCALSEKPSFAQSIFLCGEVECGKSLLQYRIITPLLGGQDSDPMPYLTGSTDFNNELADAGHWLVSDSEGGKTTAQKASFTQKIKAITANPRMTIRTKFKTPATLFLNARLTFSFNATAESLEVLPRLGTDVLGKLCLFNVLTHNFLAGLNRTSIEANIADELPAFAYWLLNEYVPPADIATSGRYPTKSYHSPELINYARASQDSSELLGWLGNIFEESENFRKDYLEKKVAVEMSAARWLQVLHATTGHHYGLKPNRLSAHFQHLAKQFPNSISTRLDPKSKVYLYKVDYAKLVEQKL